jgi:single-strand DNA-binding protein
MRTKNHVSLIGMVGKDAEVRTTQGGVQYARFTLATSTGGYKKQDGTDVPEVTQWHNITCWRNLAVMVGKYVRKGMKVDVEGMITYSQYQDQQGVQRMSVEIVADDIVLMSKSDGGQAQVQQPQQGYMPQAGYVPQQQQMNFPPQVQQQAPQQGGYAPQPAAPNNPDDLPF